MRCLAVQTLRSRRIPVIPKGLQQSASREHKGFGNIVNEHSVWCGLVINTNLDVGPHRDTIDKKDG